MVTAEAGEAGRRGPASAAVAVAQGWAQRKDRHRPAEACRVSIGSPSSYHLAGDSVSRDRGAPRRQSMEGSGLGVDGPEAKSLQCQALTSLSLLLLSL